MPAPTPPHLARLIAEWGLHSPRPLSLTSLLSFASPLSKDSVLASAEYTLSELPVRLVGRVKAFESLPYIVGTNPFISSILSGYRDTFQSLATHPKVDTLQENAILVDKLNHIVKAHSNDIATMAQGFQECTRYMVSNEIATFLDATISARIALRLIAEQHVAISRAFQDPSLRDHHVGVIDTKCSPKEMIKMIVSYVTELCEATLGAAPSVNLEGELDITFAYVPVHMEYILTEILKNSFRASVEYHHKTHGTSSRVPIPPITLTIAPCTSPGQVQSQPRKSYLSLRIRDEGGGIAPANMERIFSYAFTTAGRVGTTESESDDVNGGGGPYAAQHVGGMGAVQEHQHSAGNLFSEITGKGLQTGLGTIAGLGYGLPMAKLYASYFSGSLQLVPLFGHGTDCFIKLRCLDDGADIEI